MTNKYDAGDRIEITTSTPFQNAAGTAFDPDVVRFKVKAPGVTAVTYTYGTDDEVTQNATGDYSCTIDVETAGDWYYRIEGETSDEVNRGADEGKFTVVATEL